MGIIHNKQHVDVGALDQEVADPNRVEELSAGQATFKYSLTERVGQQQQPLLHTAGDEKHAPVGVIFPWRTHA